MCISWVLPFRNPIPSFNQIDWKISKLCKFFTFKPVGWLGGRPVWPVGMLKFIWITYLCGVIPFKDSILRPCGPTRVRAGARHLGQARRAGFALKPGPVFTFFSHCHIFFFNIYDQFLLILWTNLYFQNSCIPSFFLLFIFFFTF